jgi:hypothetical protein
MSRSGVSAGGNVLVGGDTAPHCWSVAIPHSDVLVDVSTERQRAGGI